MQLHDLAPFAPARSEPQPARQDRSRDTSPPEKGFSEVVEDTAPKEKPATNQAAPVDERRAPDDQPDRSNESVTQSDDTGRKDAEKGASEQHADGQDNAPVEDEGKPAGDADPMQKTIENVDAAAPEAFQFTPEDTAKTALGLRVAELAGAAPQASEAQAVPDAEATTQAIIAPAIADAAPEGEATLMGADTGKIGPTPLVKTDKAQTVLLAKTGVDAADVGVTTADESAVQVEVEDFEGDAQTLRDVRPGLGAVPEGIKQAVPGQNAGVGVQIQELQGKASLSEVRPIETKAPETAEGAAKAVELAQMQAMQAQIATPQMSMAEAMILSAEPGGSALDDMALIAAGSDARQIERGQMVAPSAQVFNAPDMARNVAGQIADVARVTDDGRVEVQLRPEELGRLTLSFTADGAGGMTVQLSAERPETLDLIKRNLDQLDLALADLGYGDVSYDFAESEGEGAGEGGGTGASGYGKADHETAQEERIIALGQNARAASGGVDIRL